MIQNIDVADEEEEIATADVKAIDQDLDFKEFMDL